MGRLNKYIILEIFSKQSEPLAYQRLLQLLEAPEGVGSQVQGMVTGLIRGKYIEKTSSGPHGSEYVITMEGSEELDLNRRFLFPVFDIDWQKPKAPQRASQRGLPLNNPVLNQLSGLAAIGGVIEENDEIIGQLKRIRRTIAMLLKEDEEDGTESDNASTAQEGNS